MSNVLPRVFLVGGYFSRLGNTGSFPHSSQPSPKGTDRNIDDGLIIVVFDETRETGILGRMATQLPWPCQNLKKY